MIAIQVRRYLRLVACQNLARALDYLPVTFEFNNYPPLFLQRRKRDFKLADLIGRYITKRRSICLCVVFGAKRDKT